MIWFSLGVEVVRGADLSVSHFETLVILSMALEI